MEIGVARIRAGYQHGAEAAVDRVARIEWQRAVVLRLHVTGMNVSVLRGRRWRRSLSLHRRLYALLLALRVFALSEVLRLFLLRLVLRTGRWRLCLLTLFIFLFSPLFARIQVIPPVVLNRSRRRRRRRRSLTLRAVVDMIWTHLTLHLDALLEYLMVFVLLVLETRLRLRLLLNLDLLLMRLLVLRLLILLLLLLLRDRLRWLIGIAWRHITTVTAVVVRLLLRLRYRLTQFLLLFFRHDAL